MASAMFFARGVDHCRDCVEADRPELPANHPCRLGNRGRELEKSLEPALAVLLMSNHPIVMMVMYEHRKTSSRSALMVL